MLSQHLTDWTHSKLGLSQHGVPVSLMVYHKLSNHNCNVRTHPNHVVGHSLVVAYFYPFCISIKRLVPCRCFGTEFPLFADIDSWHSLLLIHTPINIFHHCHLRILQNPFVIPFYWLVKRDSPIGLL